MLYKKEKGTLGHILGHCDVALGKTESSFNRIAWMHAKVLHTTREKALEHSKLIKTKEYQLMADLDKNRHDFLQTLRSFDSKLKPDIVLINESTKDIIIDELTCPMEAHETKTKKYGPNRRPMEARMTYWHETKTKKYHDLASRIAEKGFTVRFFAFEVGFRGWLESHCANSSLHWNFRRRSLKKLSPIALKCSRKIFLSRSSFNFKGHGPDFKLECRQATVV
jgi:hypothetical protein